MQALALSTAWGAGAARPTAMQHAAMASRHALMSSLRQLPMAVQSALSKTDKLTARHAMKDPALLTASVPGRKVGAPAMLLAEVVFSLAATSLPHLLWALEHSVTMPVVILSTKHAMSKCVTLTVPVVGVVGLPAVCLAGKAPRPAPSLLQQQQLGPVPARLNMMLRRARLAMRGPALCPVWEAGAPTDPAMQPVVVAAAHLCSMLHRRHSTMVLARQQTEPSEHWSATQTPVHLL